MTDDRGQKTEDRRQMTEEATINEKFLRMLHGPGGGFFKKSPLVAEGPSARGPY